MGWLTQCVCGARSTGSEPDVRKQSAGKRGKKRTGEKKKEKESFKSLPSPKIAVQEKSNGKNHAISSRSNPDDNFREGRQTGSENRAAVATLHSEPGNRLDETSPPVKKSTADDKCELVEDSIKSREGSNSTFSPVVKSADFMPPDETGGCLERIGSNFEPIEVISRPKMPEIDDGKKLLTTADKKLTFAFGERPSILKEIPKIDYKANNRKTENLDDETHPVAMESSNLKNFNRQLNLSYVLLNRTDNKESGNDTNAGLPSSSDHDVHQSFRRARVVLPKIESNKSHADCRDQQHRVQNSHRATMPISRLPRSKSRVKKSADDLPDIQGKKYGFKNPISQVREFNQNRNSCSFEIPWRDENAATAIKPVVQRGILNSQGTPSKIATKIRNSKEIALLNDSGLKANENGRVHSAIVSGVNWEQRSVTVEWFERGETKGKEVEIDAILALNPELTPKTMGPPPPVTNHMMPSRNKNTTRASIPVKAGSNRQIARTGRPTNIIPAITSVNGHGDSISGLSRREVENIPPTPSTPAPSSASTVAANKQKQLQVQAQQQQQLQVQQQAAQIENGRGRRSNVVREVERLKKNREERRQRQAEKKEEKEALMNLDPGNPNWEFLAMIRDYQNTIDFRPLRETDSVEDHQITVCVRKRPLNRKELNRKEVDVISVPSKDQMVVHEPKAKVDLTKYLENQLFRFDYAFDETCTNEIVYKYTAKPLVQTIFEGGMATCFAYGQTGSGKTHTMGGDFNGKTQDCKKGIYAMVAKDVFKYLKSSKFRSLNLIISASFFEIYSGKVFDLLADKEKLRVLEDGKQQVQIVGLTEKVVESCDEVLKLIQHGNSARTSGQTTANANSSRSHAVFQIIARTPGTHKVHGKFSLIDLAGNERGADTSSANRQTRMEGAEINKSLLALKECIRALGRKGTHLPFRASKLTQVLRDSFIGEKSKTCMIAMISPGMNSCEHSLNTLRYADRVKELAATDPTEMKISPTEEEELGLKIDDQTNNSVLSDSDLAQLRSLNEGELSQDLYTFHEAVSALQLLEEEVLDTHKLVVDNTARFLNDAHSVFSATHEVDYDQEDTHAMTKANSIFTLSRNWRGSNATLNTTISINNNLNTNSDFDIQSKLNSSVEFFSNDYHRSPWENELELDNTDNSASSDVDSNGDLKELKVIAKDRQSPNLRSVPTKIVKNKSFSVNNTPVEKKCPSRKSTTSITRKKSKYNWAGTFNNKAKKSISFSESSSLSPTGKNVNNNSVLDQTACSFADEKLTNSRIDRKSEYSVLNLIGKDPPQMGQRYGEKWQSNKLTNIDRPLNSKLNNFIESDLLFPAKSDNCYLTKGDVFPTEINIFTNSPKQLLPHSVLKSTESLDSLTREYSFDGESSKPHFNTPLLTKCWKNSELEFTLNSSENYSPQKFTSNNTAEVSSFEEQPANQRSSTKALCRQLFRVTLNLIRNVILFTILPAAYIAFFMFLQTAENE
ncbi:uncharacterized protein LOC105688935 isoform X3 [Athalia rosae]|uniref:uncharacterized protein LOC105688935 isoform X3 n=1 Tax=Athalia rosae TaxID=37344 RepID=UPI0020340C32|nr:uncharacterized protein LOC105688935 isoform X3 [Athalia rosae]